MSLLKFAWASASIFGLMASATAADLSKIERRSPKLPASVCKSPKFAMLVFGPKADFRVWLVLDGKTLYVDRNGNGDLTDSDEKVAISGQTFTIGAIRDGQREICTNLHVYLLPESRFKIRAGNSADTMQWVGWLEAAKPQWNDRPEDAPIMHLDGPMTFGQYGPTQLLPREVGNQGYRTTSLKLMLGTPGIGEGTFASYHCKRRFGNGPIVADAEFPGQKPGGPPIRLRVCYDTYG